MDTYTNKTKEWLEHRYNIVDKNGVYFAHQPIYGFRNGHSEQGTAVRYLHTWRILRVLSQIQFDSLVDIGGAEGFKGFLVSKIFGARVVNSDLSEEACNRSREIFGMKSVPADIHALPFKDGEFDVVLCSETLEHVADFEAGVHELLRVAKKTVIITVPYEKPGDKNALEPHAHINFFNEGSFERFREEGYVVSVERMIHPVISFPMIVCEGMPILSYDASRHSPAKVNAFNSLLPLVRQIFGRRTLSSLIRLDAFLCSIFSSYRWVIAVIFKDPFCRTKAKRKISPVELFEAFVPPHILKKGPITL